MHVERERDIDIDVAIDIDVDLYIYIYTHTHTRGVRCVRDLSYGRHFAGDCTMCHVAVMRRTSVPGPSSGRSSAGAMAVASRRQS